MPWSSRSCLKIFLPPLAWYVLSLECCNFSVAVQGFDHLWDSKHNYTRRGFHKWSEIINLITLLLLISDSMMRNNTNPRTLGREHIPPWALPMFLLSTVLVCAQSLTLHLTLGPSLAGCVPSICSTSVLKCSSELTCLLTLAAVLGSLVSHEYYIWFSKRLHLLNMAKLKKYKSNHC